MFSVTATHWLTDTPHVRMGYEVWLETLNEIADWWSGDRSIVHLLYNPKTRQHEEYTPRTPYAAVRARVAPRQGTVSGSYKTWKPSDTN